MDEGVQLHLFLSIVMLMLMLRFFGVAPDLFDSAIFACISLPATYAMTYYSREAYRVGKFVVKKKPEPVRFWSYELVALLTSFVMGYMVFVALTGSTDYITFGSAFITAQIMRILTNMLVSSLKEMGVDVMHPCIVVLISLSIAAIGFIGLSIIFTFLL